MRPASPPGPGFIRVAAFALGAMALAFPSLALAQQATPEKSPFEVVMDRIAKGEDNEGKIIDPKPADFSKNRWQVALVVAEHENNFRAQFCGGTYLGDGWVLTAAHCVDQDKALFQVFYGSGVLDKTGERMTIANKYPHASWVRGVKGYDIALIKLTAPLPAAKVSTVRPITATEASQKLKSGDDLLVTGWGVVNDAGVNSKTLNQALLPLVAPKTCNATDAYNGAIPPDMLCAGKSTGGPDSCKGDSGGPATMEIDGERRLIGVVSSGDGCGQPKRYGGYTRVGTYEEWIHKQIAPDG